MNTKLNEIFSDTADSIRKKKNTTEQIKPEQFPAKILEITTSSGSSSENYEEKITQFFPILSNRIKYTSENNDFNIYATCLSYTTYIREEGNIRSNFSLDFMTENNNMDKSVTAVIVNNDNDILASMEMAPQSAVQTGCSFEYFEGVNNIKKSGIVESLKEKRFKHVFNAFKCTSFETANYTIKRICTELDNENYVYSSTIEFSEEDLNSIGEDIYNFTFLSKDDVRLNRFNGMYQITKHDYSATQGEYLRSALLFFIRLDILSLFTSFKYGGQEKLDVYFDIYDRYFDIYDENNTLIKSHFTYDTTAEHECIFGENFFFEKEIEGMLLRGALINVYDMPSIDNKYCKGVTIGVYGSSVTKTTEPLPYIVYVKNFENNILGEARYDFNFNENIDCAYDVTIIFNEDKTKEEIDNLIKENKLLFCLEKVANQ